MGKDSQPKHTNGSANDKNNPNFKWASMLNVLDYHRWNHTKKMLVNKNQDEENNVKENKKYDEEKNAKENKKHDDHLWNHTKKMLVNKRHDEENKAKENKKHDKEKNAKENKKHNDHRWNHTKKMLVNKKHNEENKKHDEEKNAKEKNAKENKKHDKEKNATGKSSTKHSSGPDACVRKESLKKPVQEQTNDPGNSAKNSASPSSPKTKSSKTSKIKKLFTKEVSKKKGRHGRSSTCPESSGVAINDEPIHQQSEHAYQGAGDDSSQKRGKNTEIYKGEGENKSCRLCNTMHIECQSSDHGQEVKEHGDIPLDQLNMFLNEMSYDENSVQISNKNIVPRDASFQHSRDFFDAIDVLSLNRQFFLSVLNDPDASLRQHFLIQQSAPASRRKSLSKFGTFPVSHASSMDGSSSPNLLRPKDDSFKVINAMNRTVSEKPRSSLDSKKTETRSKSLRERLKHAIKKSKKERHRIAKDAVFHKVPYGHNSQEERPKGSPRLSSSESNFFSPANEKNVFKRSSTLEGSMDKYCQLFETTGSSNRWSSKVETSDRSRLKVKDESLPKKALERNFSLPDLEVSLYQQANEYEGYSSWRMSFNEGRMHGSAFHMGLELDKKITGRTGENARKEELEEDVDDEMITFEDTSNKEFETINALDDAPWDDGSIVIDAQSMMDESSDRKDLSGIDEPKLEDTESTEDVESEDSSTFACVEVDEDEVHGPIEPLSPVLDALKVSSKDEAEFNYVRDILQLSGYTSSQILGSWYSSEQPVDPSVYIEVESCSLMEPTSYLSSKDGNNNRNHLLLFDLINEVLISIYKRSVSFWPRPLSSCSRTHQMPKGYRVLEEVWTCINWYLTCSRQGLNSNLDYIVVRDFSKDDGWMNLQFDAECVGLEVEEFIFDDLLTELVS